MAESKRAGHTLCPARAFGAAALGPPWRVEGGRRKGAAVVIYPLSRRLTWLVISLAAAAALLVPSRTASLSVPTTFSISG